MPRSTPPSSRLTQSILFTISLFGVMITSVQAAKQPFNISVSDQSPTITYYPSRSGPPDQSWNVTYSDSSWSSYLNQTIGQGVSTHYTTHIGANASLGWWGTALYLHADGNESDAEVKVDNTTAKKVDDGWMLDGLSQGWHRISLRVIGNAGVGLKGITFTTGIGETGAVPVNSTVQAIFGENQINGMFSQSTGQWETGTEIGGAGNQSKQTYNRVDTYTPGSKLIFQPPNNTSFVLLYGSVNFDHNSYSVSLTSSNLPNIAVSGDAKDTITSSTTIGGIPSTQIMYGTSPWISTDQVLFYANLESSAQYTVTVENQGSGNARSYWDISKVVFVQAQGGNTTRSDKGNSNSAAIAGGVVGAIVALALIATLLWFFVFKKKENDRHQNQQTNIYEDKPFEVDPYRLGNEEDAHDAYANAASGGHTPYDHSPPSGQRDSTITPLLASSSGHSPDPNNSQNSRSSYHSSMGAVNSPNPNRLSIPNSADGYGNLYTPLSSRHASLQASQENGLSPGMILHNPDQAHLEQDEDQNTQSGSRRLSLPGNTAEMTKNRISQNGYGRNERRRSNLIQERDAGSVPLPPRVTEEHTIIPPSYDPSWARDRSNSEEGPRRQE
ncbi:uncharacterized protein IL334_006465 [Kwoniella shivajii]|uniref:Uncharacterized protein n=1 Tax=Kwoniella shivajii TaxID=564305 RepID=A0ABZ1D7N0_9TREE|nr:hypothetical protein IL334_006465 [Kwoniella shivajii]